MTFEQAFSKVKEKFENTDTSNVADFAIQLTFMDEDCSGIFSAYVRDGVLFVEPYDYKDNDLALTITKSALLAVITGRSSLDKAIANGDAYVESGDVSKIADLKNTIKKAPAKKAPAKKTETKPAAKAPAKKAETKTTAAPAKKVETKTTAAPAKKVETKTTAAPAKKAETKTTTKATATKTTATKPASKTTK